jgi:hypothetical protein
MTIFEKARILFRYYLAVFRWKLRARRFSTEGKNIVPLNQFKWETYDPNDPDKEFFDLIAESDRLFDEVNRKHNIKH